MTQFIEAELTWTGERFERGVKVETEGAGRVLARTALLPGFVSAHSHAFQRELRGREKPGTFWSWRDAMYELAGQLDADRFYEATKATFEEMLAAGITTVGEFHYLHHDYAFDEIVLHAARDAGIRLVLLMTYYETVAGPQKLFETPDIAGFWRQIDRLGGKLDSRTQSLGVAAHSIRGVPLEKIVQLYDEARRRSFPFHMHVEEQRKEIEECVKAYGRTPMQLINERLRSCEGFVAVHATHSDPSEMKRFMDRGGAVCITPLTEANLGDGIPDITQIRTDRLSIGTDSNARISMIEEMRWLEYAQRLKLEKRGIFPEGGRTLLKSATSGGASALGINATAADFVAIDLDAPSLAGVSDENLLDAITFGAGDDVITGTCVGGNWN